MKKSALLIVFLISIITTPLRAFVYFKIYYWLVFPVTQFEIEQWKLFGVMFVISMIFTDHNSSKLYTKKMEESEDPSKELYTYVLSTGILYPLFTLGMCKLLQIFIY